MFLFTQSTPATFSTRAPTRKMPPPSVVAWPVSCQTRTPLRGTSKICRPKGPSSNASCTVSSESSTSVSFSADELFVKFTAELCFSSLRTGMRNSISSGRGFDFTSSKTSSIFLSTQPTPATFSTRAPTRRAPPPTVVAWPLSCQTRTPLRGTSRICRPNGPSSKESLIVSEESSISWSFSMDEAERRSLRGAETRRDPPPPPEEDILSVRTSAGQK
mmetsp:Transcript_10456/g.20609  ORF Transcript_10456/g.20609 Transcript_10456/m.20609 type:complete len:217 (-) Transcript_10456:72-722(-)